MAASLALALSLGVTAPASALAMFRAAVATPEHTEGSEGSGARRVAERIEAIDDRLKRDLAAWAEAGRPRSAEQWTDLKLLGLRAQKNFRRMAAKPRFSKKVARHLSGKLAWKFEANMKAARALYSLGEPREPPVKMPSTQPAHPDKLLTFYEKAQRRFDVPWNVLASINFVETRFGRLKGPSSAGARGPMQFMPATWDAYGRGDIMDPHDSIMAAGRYLRANGAPGNMRRALWHYNHSYAYVDAVQIYARQIKADRRNYYGYYLYQAFARTTEGDVQLTGPGKSEDGYP